jgi:hypothetical protein
VVRASFDADATGRWLAGDRARRLDMIRRRAAADPTAFLRCSTGCCSARRRLAPMSRPDISPLKALAVDIERNLRAPLAGIAHRAAARDDAHHAPAIAVRTGDTPSKERARFQREPADILITTPESLYLLLTSNARASLRSIDTVIVDEIHALVPTKRGAHLALSLERLEHLRKDEGTDSPALQRIGLSATQRRSTRSPDSCRRCARRGPVRIGVRSRSSRPKNNRQPLTRTSKQPSTMNSRPDAGSVAIGPSRSSMHGSQRLG